MEQLVSTKFFIPPTRPELVSRPALLGQLNRGMHRKLTLISAPAGFGKTTLASEWVAGCECPVAWLSLDEADNDTVRFLTYFLTAINQIDGSGSQIGKAALGMLKSPQPPPTEPLLTSLINDFSGDGDPMIFVLDDFHLIETATIHDALSFFVENLPPQLHLVISTREDPLLPLPRLRARDQLTELRAADLRFSSAEAAQFLNQVMGLDLSAEDVAVLEDRTEGWIAGLQLAAISLQGRKDTSQLIRSFSGSHRLVLDYLIEEVLEQQPERLQNFLLKTSILDRMTASLCDALTGMDDGRKTLEILEHANLFIIPLDEQRDWYRYHHLFADLMKQRLRRTSTEQMPALHLQASEWFYQNGFYDKAIDHALRAADYDRSAELINELADTLWQTGEHGKLRVWLENLPVEYILSKPLLSISRGYYLHSIGRIDEGDLLLREAENLITKAPKFSAEERNKLSGRLAVVRALIGTFNGEVPNVIEQANNALKHLPEKDQTWRNLAAISLGDAYSYLGDMAASHRAREEVFKTCEATGDIYYTIVAGLKLASTLREQGELKQTIQLCKQQIQIAKENGFHQSSLIGCLMALLGEVLAEMNQLDEAYQFAAPGVEIAKHGGNLTLLGYSYLYLMRVLFSRGDFAGAENIFREVAKLNRETTVPEWLNLQLANWQVRIDLVRGDVETASKWADNTGPSTSLTSRKVEAVDFLQMFDFILFARILAAQNQPVKAGELLNQLLGHAEKGGRITRIIEILLLQALNYRVQGDQARAIFSLERAIHLSKPAGFLRIYVDEGQPAAQLLYEGLSRGIATEYIQQLLAAFPLDELEPQTREGIQPLSSELVEPLSEREIEVLNLIAEGLTNQEIATRLYLSLNTIKVHARNIYGKLGVTNRTQAVTRARALGLLASN